jgi:hypothetical protein
MKILSFNTYLAPTMPYRFVRKEGIFNNIKTWMTEGIEVICLQEVNDFTIGLIGYIYYRYNLYIYCSIFIQRFFDLLFVIEGIIFPLFLYDNSKELIIQVDLFNLYSDKKYYITKSRQCRRGVSGGLVILTIHKPILDKTYYLYTDCIHSPSVLYTTLQDLKEKTVYTVLNLHLIPKLENHTFLYKSVNCVNYLNNINVYNIQKTNIKQLRHIIFENIKNKNDMKKDIFVCGDFNIKKNKQLELYNYLLKNISIIGLEDNIKTTSHNYICTEHFVGQKDGENGCEVDQIDYIFSNIKSVSFDRLLDCFYLSDHYPIVSEFN